MKNRFLATLVAVLVSTSFANAGLALTNIRNTYGELGGTRPETGLIPGDALFIAFDIEGLTIDAEGKTTYVMGMDVLDKSGKAVYKNEPATRNAFVPFGGSKLAASAFVFVGMEMAAGEYSYKITVTDVATKTTQSFDRKFTVLPKEFSIVSVYLTVDEGGKLPAPTTCVVGQLTFAQFVVVNFTRDAKKQPNVSIEMQALDESGKVLAEKPNVVLVNTGVDENDPGVPIRFLIPMTRKGKFTIRIKATDSLSKKTATFNLPVTVVEPAN